jgi:transcription antitermination factor NusG
LVIHAPFVRYHTGPIYHPGPLRWYALTVYPQRENAAKLWLDRYSVVSFFPVLEGRKWRRNIMVPWQRRYIPGYVFAQFPGEPIWHVVQASPFIHGVLRRHDGEPGILHPDTLHQLHAMRAMDGELEAKRAARRLIRKGDRVRLLDGPFKGSEVEVVEVDTAAGRAKFPIKLLGQHLAEIGLEKVEKVG